MSWNSIYMTPKGYPAPDNFAKAANRVTGDAQPATVKEAEEMQFAEAMEQVCSCPSLHDDATVTILP